MELSAGLLFESRPLRRGIIHGCLRMDFTVAGSGSCRRGEFAGPEFAVSLRIAGGLSDSRFDALVMVARDSMYCSTSASSLGSSSSKGDGGSESHMARVFSSATVENEKSLPLVDLA